MAATIIPLIALAVIVFVLWVAIRATIQARRNPQAIESTTRSEEDRRRVSESLRAGQKAARCIAG
jgi:flagellar biosynthesis/type III secretory pathway M-ring protein FliF/YscJ